MNKLSRIMILLGMTAALLCNISPAMAAPGLSLVITPAGPGSPTTATVSLIDVTDIESFTLTLDFTGGTALILPAANWFTRGVYIPATPFGSATTVELNNTFESTARTRVFIDGFKPAGTVGAIGTVAFMVDNSVIAGTVQQVALSGQYLSKTSGTVSSFAPFTTMFSVSTASTKLLTVTLAGSGEGAVNSNPAGIACTDGSCATAFTSGSTVSLMATADSNSTFGGWSGACLSSLSNCSVTMDAAKSVTATFSAAPFVMLSGTIPNYYSLLQSAYATATTGNMILSRSVTLTENLLFNRPVSVKLKGGYDSSFTSATGMSTVKGTFVIRQGTVRVDRLIVQ